MRNSGRLFQHRFKCGDAFHPLLDDEILPAANLIRLRYLRLKKAPSLSLGLERRIKSGDPDSCVTLNPHVNGSAETWQISDFVFCFEGVRHTGPTDGKDLDTGWASLAPSRVCRLRARAADGKSKKD